MNQAEYEFAAHINSQIPVCVLWELLSFTFCYILFIFLNSPSPVSIKHLLPHKQAIIRGSLESLNLHQITFASVFFALLQSRVCLVKHVSY